MDVWDAPVLGSVTSAPAALAELVAMRLGERRPALVGLVQLHLEALDTSLALGAAELLADQLRWQRVRLASSFPQITMDALGAAVTEALWPFLDDDGVAEVTAINDAASVLGESGMVADSVIPLPDGPARRYLDAALGARRDDALAIVRAALLAGTDVAEIMLEILQPAQIELGRLWEAGEISVAHEHYTTAVTQLALSLLYPRLLLNRTLLGRSMVATAVGSEAHEVGIRMIADLMEQAGWRTTYLGASVPHEDVVEQVAQHRADVVAISATMAGHVHEVQVLVQAIRADRRCDRTKILVGGRPFLITPRLAVMVGADGWAGDAREALQVCRGWTQGTVPGGREHAV